MKSFYNELQKQIIKINKRSHVTVIGDFNEKMRNNLIPNAVRNEDEREPRSKECK